MTGMRNESLNEILFTDQTCSGRREPTLYKSLLRDQKGTNSSARSYLLTDYNAAETWFTNIKLLLTRWLLIALFRRAKMYVIIWTGKTVFR